MNMSVLDKIEALIENAKAIEEAGPDYVSPEAADAIDKAGIEAPEQNPVEAPDLIPEEGPAHLAGILNNLGQAAGE